jgi:uncharacterized protein YkwD
VKRPDLVWDDHLAADAQKWANHLAETNTFAHEGMRGEGENLFMQMGGGHQPFKRGVEAWVNEKKDYHGEKIGEGQFAKYGHYTQVIWPSTTKVGMATATGKNGHQVIVGRYSPPGNFSGRTAFNG